MNIELKPADLVEEFVRLRTTKEKLEKEFEERVKDQLTSRMEEIKVILLDKLNELGIDSIAGKSGTAYKTTVVSVTTADMREFRRHVIGNEDWDLCDWRPNKTRINELVEDDQPLPPGVNRTVFQTVAIRKGK
jgi:hypothetical protein